MSLRSGIAALALVGISAIAAAAYREYAAFDTAIALMVAQHASASGIAPSPVDLAEPGVAAAVREPVVAQRPAEPAVDQPQAEPRVLVMLKSREHVVTVYSGLGQPDGQQFKVAARDGQVLAERLSLADFQYRYPLLYDFYRTSFAEAWAGMELDGSHRTIAP